jgi:hypothetical protein
MDVVYELEKILSDEILKSLRHNVEERILEERIRLYEIKGRHITDLDPYGEENWEE